MSFFKRSVTQTSNAATPLAEDIVKQIREQIAGGTFGGGLGSLQREAGTSAQKFVESGGGQFDNTELFANLKKMFEKDTNDQAAQLREGFGAIGGRFGSGLAKAEGDFRANATADFGAGIGNILRQEYDSQQNRLLEGIKSLFDMGTSNVNQAMGLAGRGLPQAENVVNPSGFESVLGTASSLANIFKGLGLDKLFKNNGTPGSTTVDNFGGYTGSNWGAGASTSPWGKK